MSILIDFLRLLPEKVFTILYSYCYNMEEVDNIRKSLDNLFEIYILLV